MLLAQQPVILVFGPLVSFFVSASACQNDLLNNIEDGNMGIELINAMAKFDESAMISLYDFEARQHCYSYAVSH